MLRYVATALIVIGVHASGSFARAEMVQFDLVNGLNWDGYVSSAEISEAQSYYNPPNNEETNPDGLSSAQLFTQYWGGLSNRRVASVFGQNNSGWSHGNRNYAWQDQVPVGHVGLPTDGVISNDTWQYQLVTERDAAPEGGWGNPEFSAPNNPSGQMPIASNVIRVNRPHSASSAPAGSSYTFFLTSEQQGYYTSINMLMQGTGLRDFQIFAEYADGQALLWLGKVQVPDVALDPDIHPSHGDLEPGYTMTRRWSNAGSPAYDSQGNGTVHMWQFTNGLAVDGTRELVGFTFAFVPQQYAAGDYNVYAMSGTLIPEPASLALVGLGGIMLMGRRRTR